MSLYYLDASAWVKRHQREDGSDWIARLWGPEVRFACATLGVVEVLATVARRHAGNTVAQDVTVAVLAAVQRDFAAFTQVPLNEAVLERATDLASRRRLRGADSVHLASALYLRQVQTEQVVVVASDAELLAAARAEGLAVLDPTANPAV